jgi:cytochrome c nitrite reductase small subunit
MREEFDGWLKSSHRSVATCNSCHTPANFIGKYSVKAPNGFWHSFFFTTGGYEDNIQSLLSLLQASLGDISAV